VCHVLARAVVTPSVQENPPRGEDLEALGWEELDGAHHYVNDVSRSDRKDYFAILRAASGQGDLKAVLGIFDGDFDVEDATDFHVEFEPDDMLGTYTRVWLRFPRAQANPIDADCRRAAVGAVERHLAPLAAGGRPHARDVAYFPTEPSDPYEAATKGYVVGLRRALVSVSKATSVPSLSRRERTEAEAAKRSAIMRHTSNPASSDAARRALERAAATGDFQARVKLALTAGRVGLINEYQLGVYNAACRGLQESLDNDNTAGALFALEVIDSMTVPHPAWVSWTDAGSGGPRTARSLHAQGQEPWAREFPSWDAATEAASRYARMPTREGVMTGYRQPVRSRIAPPTMLNPPRDYSHLGPIHVPHDPHRVWKPPGATPDQLSPGEIQALMRRARVTMRDVAMASDLPLERVRELHARGALGSHAVYDMIDRINRAAYAKHLERAVDVSPIGSSEPKGHEAAGMFLGRARVHHKGVMARKAAYVDAYQRLLRQVQLTPSSAPYYQALVDGLRDLGRTLEGDLKVNLGTLKPAAQPNPPGADAGIRALVRQALATDAIDDRAAAHAALERTPLGTMVEERVALMFPVRVSMIRFGGPSKEIEREGEAVITPEDLDLTKGPFDLWQAAQRRLDVWGRHAPSGGGYHKTDFHVEWEDGDTYTGRFDLVRGGRDDNSHTLRQHVALFLLYMAGLRVPPYVLLGDEASGHAWEASQQQYQATGRADEARRMLRRYFPDARQSDGLPRSP